MSTTFHPLFSATAAPPASAEAADVHLVAYAAVVCVAGSADGLAQTRRSRSSSGRICCSSGYPCC